MFQQNPKPLGTLRSNRGGSKIGFSIQQSSGQVTSKLKIVGNSFSNKGRMGCSTWMSQEVGKWLGSMGYNLLVNGVYWGYNLLILTFDPNFQRDIQVVSFLDIP